MTAHPDDVVAFQEAHLAALYPDRQNFVLATPGSPQYLAYEAGLRAYDAARAKRLPQSTRLLIAVLRDEADKEAETLGLGSVTESYFCQAADLIEAQAAKIEAATTRAEAVEGQLKRCIEQTILVSKPLRDCQKLLCPDIETCADTLKEGEKCACGFVMTDRTPREVIAISNCGSEQEICTDGICGRCIDYADQHVAALTAAGYQIVPSGAVEAEREACAKMVEEMFGGSQREFAAAIRARGKE